MLSTLSLAGVAVSPQVDRPLPKPADRARAEDWSYEHPGTYVVRLVVDDGSDRSAGIPGDTSYTVVTVERVPTALAAEPIVARVFPAPQVLLPGLRATLRRAASGAPIAGKEIGFTADGAELCRAPTDAGGVAVCGGLIASARAGLAGGYTATFAGDAGLQPASDDGELVSP